MQHVKDRESLFVGIAGPTSSGKTTLLRALGIKLGDQASLIPFDEYLYPRGSQALAGRFVTTWEDPAIFDIERYVRDIQQLKTGSPVRLLAASAKTRSEGFLPRTITPRQYTIAEGVYTYHDPRTVDLFDLRFYIDLPTEEMIRRRKGRTSEGSTSPWDAPKYIETTMVEGTEYWVKPQRAKAHVIIDGMQSTEVMTEQVVNSLSYPKKI